LAAFGDSRAQQLEEIDEVIRAVLEDLIEKGETISEPFSSVRTAESTTRIFRGYGRRLAIDGRNTTRLPESMDQYETCLLIMARGPSVGHSKALDHSTALP